jgi:hypothetical protein
MFRKRPLIYINAIVPFDESLPPLPSCRSGVPAEMLYCLCGFDSKQMIILCIQYICQKEINNRVQIFNTHNKTGKMPRAQLNKLGFCQILPKTKVKFLSSMYSSLIPACNHEKSCVSCTLLFSGFCKIFPKILEIAFQGL